ncbi:uncharacterized protein BKA55DRAFT_578254 [Fusarium redolens]|uniref:Uncharacterized protein n=1 Tax=Fusarium redolens TaxID=48865 RepID=A0A9P9GDV6_FUSRE|nr:uncharacterized protein BKA55DRAFT_578254 [Fusarium redolens]KAH7237739.1 hypothetical protein BKA55DRAFT_578254 [Fusarium redolens]
MSMLPTIATALVGFIYDRDASLTPFTDPDEISCFGCLVTIIATPVCSASPKSRRSTPVLGAKTQERNVVL